MITVIKPDFMWLTPIDREGMLKHIERCGRVCYRSEDRITPESAAKFVRMICNRGHESVLEHASLTALITCSRACSHQLVRHRLGAYSMASQRYCNYGKKGLQVIAPQHIDLPEGQYRAHDTELESEAAKWVDAMERCYENYLEDLEHKIRPEDARFHLPNATATTLAVTYNLRMWKHVIKTRCDPHAQWEIRGIFNGIRKELVWALPPVFGDLKYV